MTPSLLLGNQKTDGEMDEGVMGCVSNAAKINPASTCGGGAKPWRIFCLCCRTGNDVTDFLCLFFFKFEIKDEKQNSTHAL